MYLKFMFYFDKSGEFKGFPFKSRNLVCAVYNPDNKTKAVGYEILRYNPDKHEKIFGSESFNDFILNDKLFNAYYDKYGKLCGVSYVD